MGSGHLRVGNEGSLWVSRASVGDMIKWDKRANTISRNELWVGGIVAFCSNLSQILTSKSAQVVVSTSFCPTD